MFALLFPYKVFTIKLLIAISILKLHCKIYLFLICLLSFHRFIFKLNNFTYDIISLYWGWSSSNVFLIWLALMIMIILLLIYFRISGMRNYYYTHYLHSDYWSHLFIYCHDVLVFIPFWPFDPAVFQRTSTWTTDLIYSCTLFKDHLLDKIKLVNKKHYS